jgi:hypothetical protein
VQHVPTLFPVHSPSFPLLRRRRFPSEANDPPTYNNRILSNSVKRNFSIFRPWPRTFCTQLLLALLSQKRIKLEFSLLLKGSTNRTSRKCNFSPRFPSKIPKSTSPLMIPQISPFANVHPFCDKHCIARFPIALEIDSELTVTVLAVYNTCVFSYPSILSPGGTRTPYFCKLNIVAN